MTLGNRLFYLSVNRVTKVNVPKLDYAAYYNKRLCVALQYKAVSIFQGYCLDSRAVDAGLGIASGPGTKSLIADSSGCRFIGGENFTDASSLIECDEEPLNASLILLVSGPCVLLLIVGVAFLRKT